MHPFVRPYCGCVFCNYKIIIISSDQKIAQHEVQLPRNDIHLKLLIVIVVIFVMFVVVIHCLWDM